LEFATPGVFRSDFITGLDGDFTSDEEHGKTAWLHVALLLGIENDSTHTGQPG